MLLIFIAHVNELKKAKKSTIIADLIQKYAHKKTQHKQNTNILYGNQCNKYE